MQKESTIRAALLNADVLNFDERLSFEPLAAAATLIHYGETDREQVVERAQDCQILISKEQPLDEDIIERLPREVRLICEAGTGFDNIDIDATDEKNITVCNVPGYSTSSVAQLTMCSILALSTGMHRLIRSVAERDFADFQGEVRPPHSDVAEKTLGVIGAGAIGQRVICLARAFDMNVLVYNPSARSWDDKRIKKVEWDELLEKSHFVSLHRPYKDDSYHLICAETISQMRQRPCLINTARGKFVNHEDLVKALRSGQLSGAALDVQDPEPLPASHDLWSMQNVILTAHIGWKAIESRIRLIEAVASNIRAFHSGTPTNVVKPR